jgi:hypothetical protein
MSRRSRKLTAVTYDRWTRTSFNIGIVVGIFIAAAAEKLLTLGLCFEGKINVLILARL